MAELKLDIHGNGGWKKVVYINYQYTWVILLAKIREMLLHKTYAFWRYKKGAAKQSRINAITEFDWEEQGLISSCGQADWNTINREMFKLK